MVCQTHGSRAVIPKWLCEAHGNTRVAMIGVTQQAPGELPRCSPPGKLDTRSLPLDAPDITSEIPRVRIMASEQHRIAPPRPRVQPGRVPQFMIQNPEKPLFNAFT